MEKINVALVGLNFGGAFVEIYKSHPNVGEVTVFDPDKDKVISALNRYGKVRVASTFEEILKDKSIDAVHLVTPIPCHAEQTISVLNAGKHCACTVPMATNLEDVQRIVNAVKCSGKNYMMMETTLYTYQFFYISEMKKNGEFGKIQYLRGSHYQDMSGWPSYWQGLPPMWYGTHAIAPMRVIADSPLRFVNCFGSGQMPSPMQQQYGNPYPIETAFFTFENGLKGDAIRTLFETMREYQEGICVYGSQASFEWGYLDCDRPYVTKKLWNAGKNPSDRVRRVEMPNCYAGLPKSLWKYTVGDRYDKGNPIESLKKGEGGAHHGAHPHLVDEFIRSIVENRKPAVNVALASNITAACICAHQSAMENGRTIGIPSFGTD